MTTHVVDFRAVSTICAHVKRLGCGAFKRIRRYGEEFVVLLPESGEESAMGLARRVMQLPVTLLQGAKGRTLHWRSSVLKCHSEGRGVMRSNSWRQLAKQVTEETNPKKMSELIHELKHLLGERERDERIALTRDVSSSRVRELILRSNT